MKLIMVRHGESQANVKGIYSGWTDYDLTERGKEQAEKAGEYLKNINIDKIYSSPIKRALKTAQIISSQINKDIKIIDDLKEINFGIFDGKTHKEIIKVYKDEYENWVKNYIKHRISQGESLEDLYNRINNFINKLKKDNNDKTYLIVTHGGVIQVLITILLDLDIEKMWNFKIPTGAIVEVEYNEDFGILTKLISLCDN